LHPTIAANVGVADGCDDGDEDGCVVGVMDG